MTSEESKKLLFEMINERKLADIGARFIDVLRINMFIVDRLGQMILPPQREKYGGVFLTDPSLGLGFSYDLQGFIKQFGPQGKYLEAVKNYDLRCFAIPIYGEKEQVIGYIVVGPIILNKKLSTQEYENIANKSAVEPQRVLEQLIEIRVVSYVVMDLILDLLSAIVKDMVEMNLEKKKLDEIRLKQDQLPKEFGEMAEEIYETVRLDELMGTLLDVALKMTQAECGSIMMVNSKGGDLTIKVSRGLDEEKVRNMRQRVGEGIAGLAAKENQAFVIGDKNIDNRIKHLLKRPEIKHSLVMPLMAKNQVFAVLNLHTKNPESKIAESLDSLQYLSKLISTAF